MPHKAPPIPDWVWRLRILANLKKRPRLVLANRIVNLRALPRLPHPSKLPKDVLKLTPSPDDTGVTVTWTTDEPTDSQVNYGTTTSYASSTMLDPTLVTNHSVTLSSLTPGTVYHFSVRSADGLGQVATSSDYTVVTTNSALDAATNAWINAVVAAGGTVSPTEQTNVNNLVTCLKTNNLFSLADRDWLFAAENQQQADIDIIHDAALTIHGTESFATSTGYTGNSSTGYLNTNFVPATAGGNYATTSASFGVYVLTSRAGTSGIFDIGMSGYSSPGYFDDLNPLLNSSHQSALSINGYSNFPGGATSSQGQFIVTATSSASEGFYRNGTLLQWYAGALTGLADYSFTIGGSYNAFSTDQIAEAFIAGGMNATQTSEWSMCHNTYMTAMGVNVY